MELPESLAFVDVETTGLSPKDDRVIDVGIIRVEKGEIVEEFESVVNPRAHVPQEILKFTGLSMHEIERAPTFEEVKPKIKEITQDAVFVAHNARFDYGFLKNEFIRYNDRFRARLLCTVKLSRLLNPELPSHSLESIIRHFSIPVAKRHRALPDAKATWEFFRIIKEVRREDEFLNAISKIMKRPTLPHAISEKDIQKLPEGPGVYVFYDTAGLALYVGKSINIRDRVLSHFSSYHQSTKEMKIAKNTASVEAHETAGELGALLKESELVKELQPLYNRQLRRTRKLIAAIKRDGDKYDKLELIDMDEVEPENFDKILAIFKSRKQARNSLYETAKEYKLCPKLLNLESGKDKCFNYQLGKCNGACVDKENVLMYNLRFTTAFSGSKIPSWPFSGPILIEEVFENKREGHVILNWCYAGTVKDGSDLPQTNNVYFDYDALKIIRRFITNPKQNCKIKML